jgi:predicted metal-dependent hydrolase
MVSGESHYFLGRRYRLCVVESVGDATVHLRNMSTIELCVRSEMDAKKRGLVLRRWYRQRLKELIPPLLEKWQKLLGIQAAEFRVKRMKTKWGTCNQEASRIWLNLELVKKPVHCVEYVIVHELAHLIERRRNNRFVSIMDQHLPQWRLHRNELNSAPLAYERWTD